MDVISANYLLPFNAMILCIVVGWLMGDKLYEVFNNKLIKIIIKIFLKFVIPLVFVLIIKNAI